MTGLEIDGPLEQCVVKYGDEQKTTDELGNVAFDVSDDYQEGALEKEGGREKTKTIKPDETDHEVYIPMYVTDTISGKQPVFPETLRQGQEYHRDNLQTGSDHTNKQ